MKSMTGYGFSTLGNKEFKVFISVKSVNSRFMDIKYYLPPFYSSMESEFQKILFGKCSRGQFFIRVNRIPQMPPSSFVLQRNKEQAKKWKNLYENLSKELKIRNNLNVTDLVNQSGVVNAIEKPVSLSVSEKNKIKMTFQQALKSCLKERVREGAALKVDILNHIRSIQSYLKKIKNLSDKQQKKHKNTKSNGEFSETGDMNEEIVRMEEHLRYFKTISESHQSIGKKMDFYVQELLREVNTLGSKSQISSLTKCVVEIKSILEKIKEQVQNIE